MAIWVRFERDYDERRTARSFVHHKAGSEAFVREEIAQDVERLGVGARFEKDERPEGKKTTKGGKTVDA